MKTTSSSHLRRIRGIFLAAGFASFILPPSAVLAANITWSSAASGDWATGANWTGGVAPADNTTTDDAYFDDNGTYTVSLAADRNVRRLYVTGSANPEFAFGIHTLNAPSLMWIQGGSASLTSGTIATVLWQGYRASNSTFTLDGLTANVTSNGGLVGYSDSTQSSDSNTLFIRNGADFTSATTFSIGLVAAAGVNVSSSGNKTEVTGAGSTFSSPSAGGINMGFINGGSNTGRTANNNSIVINDGGEVSTQILYVGRQAPATAGTGTSTGNSVTIGGTGTGSVLNIQSSASPFSLNIGFGGATNNMVTVNAGGEINMNGMSTRVYGSTGNVLRIFGGAYSGTGGKILVENSAKMYLGAGGSATANEIEVLANGRFGDKSDAANAGFTSGTLILTTMTYRPTVAFSVGDNSGTTPAIYNMNSGVHSFGGGIVIEESEGRLTGNGTIQGLSAADTTLTVNGLLAPGNSVGIINVTGNLLSGSSAVFNFEIAGLASFDQLNMTGNAAFAGTLNVSLINSFNPGQGDSFDLFDFVSTSSPFDALNLPSLGGSLSWDTSTLYTDGIVSVVPEPSIIGLLTVCGLGLALLRRRRNY